MLHELHKVYPDAAVFTVLPGFPFSQPQTSQQLEPQLPSLLSTLFNPMYVTYTDDQLSDLALETFHSLQVTQHEADILERSTRQQSSSCLCHDHKQGRVTASKFYAVAKCAKSSYPTTIVKSIMHYDCTN